MRLRPSKFNKGSWYGCSNFPKCKITSALHPDGTLLSTPADNKVKILRIQCHALADRLWGKGTKCDKQAMYYWLKKNTRTGHIGLLEKDELFMLLKKIREHAKKLIYGRNN